MKNITVVEPGSGQDAYDLSLEMGATVGDALDKLGKDPKKWSLTPVGDDRIFDRNQDLYAEAVEGQKFHLLPDASVGSVI